MIAPTLSGQGVTLRHHVADDFAAFWSFHQSPCAAYLTSPKTKTDLYYGLGSEVGAWSLFGMGGWAIDVDGECVGQIAVTQPPHYPETEIGWLLFDGFEGRSIAFTAATLVLDYTWSKIRPATLVSYIAPENDRSIRLAQRLGAHHDPDAKSHNDLNLVFRHRRPE